MLTPIQKEHLDLIRKGANGSLAPGDVVQDARNPNSPLHDLFEWNDTAAARAYRLDQASKIIRVVVRVTRGASRRQRVVVRQSAAPPTLRYYVATATTGRDPKISRDALHITTFCAGGE